MAENRSILEYKKQTISTMSRGELLVRLFDEALKNLRYASILLNEKNDVSARACTEKCKNIFNHLSLILNRNYALSADLYNIYFFLNQEIIRADVKRDASIIDGIVPLVKELHDTWMEANRLCHKQSGRLQIK